MCFLLGTLQLVFRRYFCWLRVYPMFTNGVGTLGEGRAITMVCCCSEGGARAGVGGEQEGT